MTSSRADLSTALVDSVEEFKTLMIDTDRGLKDRMLGADKAQAQVTLACAAMETALRAHIAMDAAAEKLIGGFVFRETFPYLSRSRFADRAYTKPRGYAGDYATIAMLYDNGAEGDGRLGPLIDRWTRSLPAAQAVRNRRALLATAIRQVVTEWDGPRAIPITSLAAGPARELFDVIAAPDRPRVSATCIDIDPQAVAYGTDFAEQLGVSDSFLFARDNVIRMAHGHGRTEIGQQALIYSLGLTDYLRDDQVVKLLDWSHAHLLPGGKLIVGNVIPTNPDRAFMEHLLEWPLIDRTEDQWRQMFAQSTFGADATLSMYLEPEGVDLFVTCQKL